MERLTVPTLKRAASEFASHLSGTPVAQLYGVTDGKAVGTYVEHAFHKHLGSRFQHEPGSSASGIDFPSVGVDLKVTSIRQPQSSCPFRSADQKVYGLGHHLLVLVYHKQDDTAARVAHRLFGHVIFIERDRTGDYQTTRGLLEMMDRGANRDDVVAFLEDRNLPLDEVGRQQLAERILAAPPQQGYLTVSNALQWRLQYGRAIALAAKGSTPGLESLVAPPGNRP